MKQFDLCLFIGQSNMAGRGITSNQYPEKAPILIPNAGYEFRAVSDPSVLFPISEPFGLKENRPDGINDVFEGNILAKTGSLVTAFCNEYYQNTNIPIVGVSASKGGSHISQWLPDSKESYLRDSICRFQAAEEFLLSHGYQIRKRFMLWCQGESDGDLGTKKATYERSFNACMEELNKIGIQSCFIIQIGYCNYSKTNSVQQIQLDKQYQTIQEALEAIALSRSDTTIVSRVFTTMRRRGLMKDAFHYYQQGYNECGREAGKSVATIFSQQ